MKNIYSIIANKSVVAQDSNMLSIFDCIEELHINIDKEKSKKNEILKIPIKLEIISLWEDEEFDENKYKERKSEYAINLFDSEGKKLDSFASPMVFAVGMKRLRTITVMEGFPITTSGRYVFKIMFRKSKEDKYQKVSEIPIEVIIAFNPIKEDKTT